MTRDIKFRAWDGKQYYYDVIPLFKTKEIILNHSFLGNKLHEVKAFEQFTGLRDKNGKEIYEGDIVRWGFQRLKDGEFHNPKINVIRYKGAGFKIIGKYEDIEDSTEETGIDYLHMEVLGNIHENPELLKEEQK